MSDYWVYESCNSVESQANSLPDNSPLVPSLVLVLVLVRVRARLTRLMARMLLRREPVHLIEHVWWHIEVLRGLQAVWARSHVHVYGRLHMSGEALHWGVALVALVLLLLLEHLGWLSDSLHEWGLTEVGHTGAIPIWRHRVEVLMHRLIRVERILETKWSRLECTRTMR